ncbi:unnamed protein product [marine sediment metagenome]|uniref:Uncharacterized protein n=1 Tax=marine sediment metagenome TaxID=412755 RepID=X1ART8_9ZZZZ
MKRRKKSNRQDVLDELEFSLVTFEPLKFKVKPIRTSFRERDRRFSGLVVDYKGVKGFIPRPELKKPYCILKHAQQLIKDDSSIKVYLESIEENKKAVNSEKWQIPIFTMVYPRQTRKKKKRKKIASSEDFEKSIEIKPGIFETKLRKEEPISLSDNIEIKVLGVEYHRNEKNRPKSVVLKITAPSKYPVIRPEYRDKDLDRWNKMPEHGEKKTSVSVRRFFYEEKGRNLVEIGGYKWL